MEEKCHFGKLLNEPCHKDHFTRGVGIEKIITLSEETQEILLWRAGLIDTDIKKEMTICLHHKSFFGDVFERRNEKCCGILKKHIKKVKGKRAKNNCMDF